jgi:hypothetical protein
MVLLPHVAHRVLRPTRCSSLFGPWASRPTILPVPTAVPRSEWIAHDSVTWGRSPEVSSTTFCAQLPDYHRCSWWAWTSRSFARSSRTVGPPHPVSCSSARAAHASFRPRLATMPWRFSSRSPPPGWTGTSTPKLSNMLGTQQKPRSEDRGSCCSLDSGVNCRIPTT